MFDRHQAEITVMQFRGHSLLMRQSMRVSCDFLPCPISSAKPANAISFDYWPLECSGMFARAESQNTFVRKRTWREILRLEVKKTNDKNNKNSKNNYSYSEKLN